MSEGRSGGPTRKEIMAEILDKDGWPKDKYDRLDKAKRKHLHEDAGGVENTEADEDSKGDENDKRPKKNRRFVKVPMGKTTRESRIVKNPAFSKTSPRQKMHYTGERERILVTHLTIPEELDEALSLPEVRKKLSTAEFHVKLEVLMQKKHLLKLQIQQALNPGPKAKLMADLRIINSILHKKPTWEISSDEVLDKKLASSLRAKRYAFRPRSFKIVDNTRIST